MNLNYSLQNLNSNYILKNCLNLNYILKSLKNWNSRNLLKNYLKIRNLLNSTMNYLASTRNNLD